MDDSRILPFTARTGRGSGNGQEPPADDELVEPGNAYAVARGTRKPPYLRFLTLTSGAFAVPCDHPPIIWGESPELIVLEYPALFSVILAGKNLGQLEARLCDQRVTWIRQCDDATAAGLATAVTRIERINRYPSREPDGIASDK